MDEIGFVLRNGGPWWIICFMGMTFYLTLGLLWAAVGDDGFLVLDQILDDLADFLFGNGLK